MKEKVGFREGECRSDGFWVTVKDTCVLRIIEQLQQESQVCFSVLLSFLLLVTHKIAHAALYYFRETHTAVHFCRCLYCMLSRSVRWYRGSVNDTIIAQSRICLSLFICFIFKGLDAETLTDFVDKLNNATINNEGEIVQSEATVSAMVEILNNIADVTQTVMLDEVVITVS